MKYNKLIIGAVVLAVLVVGAVAAFAIFGGATALEGTSWRLIQMPGTSVDPTQFVITAAFDHGKISGNSGVNTYSGTYSISRSGSFAVGDLASTLIAGPADAMQAEQTYTQRLREAHSYMKDTRLTLFDSQGKTLLVFEPGP